MSTITIDTTFATATALFFKKNKNYLALYKFPKEKRMFPINASCALKLHLLSDANLCRVHWLIDVLNTSSFRKNLYELTRIIQYMKIESEDEEEPSLNEIEQRVLLSPPMADCATPLCIAFSRESSRRMHTFWEKV